MATVSVTHNRVTGAAANPKVLVDGPAWDEAHVVSGLENVDNTSDLDKPISTAQQTALDLKANLASPTFTGTVNAPLTKTAIQIPAGVTASNFNTSFQDTAVSSLVFSGDTNSATNAPKTGWWFNTNMRHANGSSYWGRQDAWGWEDNANEYYSRNVQNGAFGSWVRFLHTGNVAETAPLPPGFVSVLVSQAADTDHDITFAAGKCRDSTDAANIVLASAITKQIDAAWAVGSAAGGLDTGAVANNTPYYLWVIKRSDTGVVDALFSASATAPTMPASYDYKQLVGAVHTDGSANIRPFVQSPANPSNFRYKTEPNDVSVTNLVSATSTLFTLSVPPNTLVDFRATCSDNTLSYNFVGVVFTSPDCDDLAPDMNTAAGSILFQAGAYVGVMRQTAEFTNYQVNGSSQIRARGAIGTDTQLDIRVRGFTMKRGIVP